VDPISEAMEFARLEYERDRRAVLGEAERKQQLYGSPKRRLNAWSRGRGCIFRECTNRSIKRSHSIQKSGALLAVSKNAVVLTPQLDLASGEMRLVERGIAQASVFPGFCAVHEALFEPFEQLRELNATEHVWLQIYRTICREVVRLEIEVGLADRLVADYASLRDRKLLDLMEKRLGQQWLKRHDVNLRHISLGGDPVLIRAQRKAEELRSTLAELKSEHLAEIEALVPGRLGEAVGPFGFTVNEILPVTLSGMGSFTAIVDESPRRVLALLGVFPNIASNSTTLVMHGKAADLPVIDAYMKLVRTPLDALSMVERWMIRGTDHWFLNPDIWPRKSPDGQEALLTEMLDEVRGITHEVEISLFDELRERLLHQLAGTLDAATVLQEQAKLMASRRRGNA
jgi:hypothetical protein